jgi:hypothetical protein
LIVGQLHRHMDKLEKLIVDDPRAKDATVFEENKV